MTVEKAADLTLRADPSDREISPRFASAADFYAWALATLKLIGKLTPAEVRVCEHLMLGRRYIDIAHISSISEETVRWHVKRILRKVEAETTREFILIIGRSIDEFDE